MFIHDKIYSFITYNTPAWCAYFYRFISPRIHYTVVFEWSTRVCNVSTAFLAASFHSLAVFGHEYTILAVAFDSLHLLSASAFTNICNWTLPSHYFMKTCIQYHYTIIVYIIMHLKTLMIRLDTLFTNCFIIKKWRRKALDNLPLLMKSVLTQWRW